MQQSISTAVNVAKPLHDVTMSSRDIAEVTGKEHKNVKRDIESMLADLAEDALTFERIYFDSMNRQQTEYHLDRRHVECLLTGYNAALRMKVIDRMHQLEVGVSITPPSALADSLLFVEFASRLLHLPQSGTLGMLRKAVDAHQLPNLLPDYAVDAPNGGTSSEVTHSASELLGKLNVKLSAVAFNKKMIAAGLLMEMERPSSKGGVKKFKSLTESGFRFGKNLTTDKNQKETQPHYYDSQFPKLLALIGV